MTFNPGQARDDHGRWVAGSSGSTKAKKQNAATAVTMIQSMGHQAQIFDKPGRNWIAMYSNTDGKIYINQRNSFWADPVGYMQNQKQLSSNSPEHTIHHEIGHALYDPPDNFMGGGEHRERARSQVSNYAAMNPKEFVSEVHAGTMAGKNYSPEIMQMFKVYASPRQK